MAAVDAEDRKDKPLPQVRMTARIEPEWLIELFPDHVQERSAVEWNRSAERVEAVSALLYDELVIQESRGAAPDAGAAAGLLAQKALEVGIGRFLDQDLLNEFVARAEFAGFEPPDLPHALEDLCLGLRSFTELKSAAANLIPMLERNMTTQRLDELAPHASGCPMGDRRRSITSTANRPGSRLASRIFSACEKRRGLGGSKRRSWFTC